ncbi:HAMP domain-containing protein [Cellulomonas sp. APG4]|uniref:sensor histidine kinase n=1 Tax=Cellulomonas sp. APG4 TaxID=1538656 RepID=UPI0013795FD8|nr:HAMP domain-containing protein [Cellulomonas sp. APG4]
MTLRGWATASGLAARLLAALALVVLAGGLTAWVVAGAIGPAVFHQHMLRADLGAQDPAVVHAEEAFRSASSMALSIALAMSVLASLAVSLFLTQRIAASLGTLSAATTRVAAGHFDSRVASPRLGTEFEQLAASFNHMATQLEESEALRRRLLADVAHEVRTPVAILRAYLEGLEDGVESLTPQTVTVLQDQGARLARLAEDLAAVTRVEGGDLALVLEPTPVELLVTSARDAAEDRYSGAGIGLELDLQAGLPAVAVDRDRISQVLGNLLDNALRHTPTGGHVVISADRLQDGRLRIAVSDDGEGIDAAHLPHVFERFYRVDTARDRDHGGSGIGLAIVRAIVHAHEGSIRARSEGLGRGTTFEFTLPPLAARS